MVRVEVRPSGKYLQWEKEGEPAQHILGYERHTLRMYADSDVPIENCLEVSTKAMKDARVWDMERKFGRTHIVAVGQWKTCRTVVSQPKPVMHHFHTLLRKSSILPRMLKFPAFLHTRTARPTDAAAVVAQDVDSMQHDDIGGLGRLRVLIGSRLVIQLRGREGCDVRRIRRRDRDALGCSQSAKQPRRWIRRNLTFQEPRSAIQAFGTELVVAKRAQKLAHENIDLFWHFQSPHITVEKPNLLIAPFCFVTFLKAAYCRYQWGCMRLRVAGSSRHVCVRVLLNGVDERLHLRTLNCLESTSD